MSELYFKRFQLELSWMIKEILSLVKWSRILIIIIIDRTMYTCTQYYYCITIYIIILAQISTWKIDVALLLRFVAYTDRLKAQVI